MATRIYLPSSGSAPVAPSTWNHANQAGTTYTLPGVLVKGTTAMTSRTTASGTTNPYTRAVMRYVIGPLAPNQISGTVNFVMRVSEAATGANATFSIAVKIIQSGGADRSVLLAATASDNASSPYEFSTSLYGRRAYDVNEARPISLTSQTPTDGDYLVVEIGFRSATSVTRNIVQRHGDDVSTDMVDEDGSNTNDYAPWVEFSNDIPWQTLWPTTTISDIVGVGESVTVRLEVAVPVITEGITVGEVVTLYVPVLPVNITISDSVTLTEARTLVVGTVVVPTRTEAVTLTESVSLSGLQPPDLSIGVVTVNGATGQNWDCPQIVWNQIDNWSATHGETIWFGRWFSHDEPCGVRFALDGAVPSGARILSAKVRCYGNNNHEVDDFWIHVSEDDDAPAYPGEPAAPGYVTPAPSPSITTYPTTSEGTGAVHINQTAFWAADGWNEMEIAGLIQHLVDTYSGLAQNAHVFVWMNADSAWYDSTENGFYSYEAPSESLRPQLIITYNNVHEHVTVSESVGLLIYTPTRFYLQSTGTPAINPVEGGFWDDNSQITPHKLSFVKESTALTSYSVNEVAPGSYFVGAVRLVSPPLFAATVPAATLWRIVARIMETSGALLTEQTAYIKVVDGVTGAKKDEAFSGGWDYQEAATSLTARSNNTHQALYSSIIIEEGDRLVIELGFRFTNTTTTQHTGTIQLGDTPASALAYNDTDTSANYPWFEIDYELKQKTLEISVSESVTLSESRTLVVGAVIVPTRSDSITVAESVTVQVEAAPSGDVNVSVSDNVAVADSQFKLIVYGPNQSVGLISTSWDDFQFYWSGSDWQVLNSHESGNGWFGRWGGKASLLLLRFTIEKAILSGKTIPSAKVRLYNTNGDAGCNNFWVHVTEDDDAPALSAIGERPTWLESGSSVTFPTTEEGSGGVNSTQTWLQDAWNEIEIAPLIQHLVDTYGGLAAGSHISVWIHGDDSSSNENAHVNSECPTYVAKTPELIISWVDNLNISVSDSITVSEGTPTLKVEFAYFGKITVGGAESSYGPAFTWHNYHPNLPWTCPGTGKMDLKELSLYCKSNGGTPGLLRCAIYSSDASTLIAEGVDHITVDGTSFAWRGHGEGLTNALSPAVPVLDGGTSYLICFSTSSLDTYFTYDSVSGANCWTRDDYTESGFPEPISNIQSAEWVISLRAGVLPSVDCHISVSDSVTTSESVTVQVAVISNLNVSVSDSVTVSESRSIYVPGSRFYFPSTPFYVPHNVAPVWSPKDDTVWWVGGYGWDTSLISQQLANTSFGYASLNNSYGTPNRYSIAQFISRPFHAKEWSPADKLKMQFRVSADGPGHQKVSASIRVVSADGQTVRGVLYRGDGLSMLQSGYNRGFGVCSVQNNVSMQEGDRLCLELGTYDEEAGGTWGYFRIGDVIAGTSDCPESEENLGGTDYRAWLEFNTTLVETLEVNVSDSVTVGESTSLYVPGSRFYFPSSGCMPVSSARDTDFFLENAQSVPRPLDKTRSNTEDALFANYGTSGNFACLFRNALSHPLKAFEFTTTHKLKIQFMASASIANHCFSALQVYVVSGDGGTRRGVLYEGINAVPVNTSPRKNNNIGGILTVQNAVSVQEGDRLVVDLGFDFDGTSGNGIGAWDGDPYSTDLPEDTSEITERNPWFETNAVLEEHAFEINVSDSVTVSESVTTSFGLEIGGPTVFGNAVQYAGNGSQPLQNQITGYKFALPFGGLLKSIYIWVRDGGSASGHFAQLGVYDDFSPRNLRANTDALAVPAAEAWMGGDFSHAHWVPAGDYWLVVNPETNYLWLGQIYSAGFPTHEYKTQTYGVWDQEEAIPWTAGDPSAKPSFYAYVLPMERILVEESVTVQVEVVSELNVSVSDSITIGEGRVLVIGDLLRSVSDSVTVTETRSVLVGDLSLVTSQSITKTELTPTGLVSELTLSTLQGVGATEGSPAILVGELTLSTFQGLTITEVSPNVSVGAGPERNVSVFDNVTKTEITPTLLVSEILLVTTQGVTKTEVAPTLLVGELALSTTQGLTTTESPAGQVGDLLLVTSQSVTKTEVSPTLVGGDITIVTSQGVTKTELQPQVLIVDVSVVTAQGVSLAEAPAGNVSELFLNTAQSVTASEYVNVVREVAGNYYVSVSDNVTAAEGRTLLVSELFLSTAQSVTKTEGLTTALDDLAVNRSDAVQTIENGPVVLEPLVVAIQEGVSLAENRVVALESLVVSSQEAVHLTEGRTIENGELVLQTLQGVALGESGSVSTALPGTYYISVSEGVSLGETQALLVSSLLLLTTQAVAIGEYRGLYLELWVAISEAILNVQETRAVLLGGISLTSQDQVTLGEESGVAPLGISLVSSQGVSAIENASVYYDLYLGASQGIVVSETLESYLLLQVFLGQVVGISEFVVIVPPGWVFEVSVSESIYITDIGWVDAFRRVLLTSEIVTSVAVKGELSASVSVVSEVVSSWSGESEMMNLVIQTSQIKIPSMISKIT